MDHMLSRIEELPMLPRQPILREHMVKNGYASCYVHPTFPKEWAKNVRRSIDDLDRSNRELTLEGTFIEQHLPWFAQWYSNRALIHAQTALSYFLTLPPLSSPDSLTIKRVRRGFGEYGEHDWFKPRTSKSLVGILFLNTLPADVGGQLVLQVYQNDKESISITPQEGLLVFFPGGAVPYCFTPFANDQSLYFALLCYRWPEDAS